MKLFVPHRRWILVALPFLLGVALWRAPLYSIGSVQSSIGIFTNGNLARKEALCELSRLIQTHPFKNNFVVFYSFHKSRAKWEISYKKQTQMLINEDSNPGARSLSIIFETSPLEIERAAKLGQIPIGSKTETFGYPFS